MADVSQMLFKKVFPLLVQKTERKERSKDEVLQKITSWLTGYTPEQLLALESSEATYGEFIREAPLWNKASDRIKGRICGVKVEEIEDEFMRKVRQLDKLVDELAKGKTVEKILSSLASHI